MKYSLITAQFNIIKYEIKLAEYYDINGDETDLATDNANNLKKLIYKWKKSISLKTFSLKTN